MLATVGSCSAVRWSVSKRRIGFEFRNEKSCSCVMVRAVITVNVKRQKKRNRETTEGGDNPQSKHRCADTYSVVMVKVVRVGRPVVFLS